VLSGQLRLIVLLLNVRFTPLVIFYPSAVAVSEIVRLQLLVKSFCLHIYAHLLYCALILSKQMRMLE